MKILLISANFEHKHCLKNKILAKFLINPSLVLPQIAASIPKKHEVVLIDDAYQKIDYDNDYDLIGISTATPSAPRAYEIADEFRQEGKKVILGGIHPSLLPLEAKEHADSVVIGEAELTMKRLLKDFERGKLKNFYIGNGIEGKDIPPPRRELLKIKPLFAAVQTSRGCPYACNFCTLTRFQGKRYRHRPIKNLIEEIKRIDRKFLIFIHDASLTIDASYAKKFFREMKKLNKKFICYGNAPILARDDELLKLSKEAGCVCWLTGFESVSQASLNEAGKNYRSIDYYKMVRKIKKYGMGVVASFIFGFDKDTPDIFDLTLDAVYDWGLDAAEFNILTPFPSTPLFEKLDMEGRILTKDWEKYNLHDVVFIPKNMTPKELFYGVKRISNKFYSIKNFLKRSLSIKNFSIVIAGINLAMRLFHKEYKKPCKEAMQFEKIIKKEEIYSYG